MPITARQVHDHLRSGGTCADWRHTATVLSRRPDTLYRHRRGVAVVQSALEVAHDEGLNLFVTHEPTFASHPTTTTRSRLAARPAQGVAFLKGTGMVVTAATTCGTPTHAWHPRRLAVLARGEPLARDCYHPSTRRPHDRRLGAVRRTPSA